MISIDEFERLVGTHLPAYQSMGLSLRTLEPVVQMCLPATDDSLRPGGTISGPAMMTLADAVMYALVLKEVGMQPLAVTTQLSINFLRKPAMADLTAIAEPLKVGRRLLIGDVRIFSEVANRPLVAQASVTYSVPPQA